MTSSETTHHIVKFHRRKVFIGSKRYQIRIHRRPHAFHTGIDTRQKITIAILHTYFRQ
jgi:hypothetical protein